ncbi:glutathione-dependent formaldehyde dehydrogenase [archaeon]|nr:MAG: glutathione-dependent formaldehyde dehydrogenase [archaeon]
MLNTAAKIADNIMGRHPTEGTPHTDVNPADTMRALTWRGRQSVAVERVPKPVITDPRDVIVKVTSCAICSGTDLHIFNGEMPGIDSGMVLGHEGMGVIEQKGDQVNNLNVGDRVIIAACVACGHCDMCQRQEFTACRTTNDSKVMEKSMGHNPSAMFGHTRLLGNTAGSQAEFVRVPFAETNCFKVPDNVPDDKAVCMTDVLATSLHAVEMGHVKEGDTVCIWGLGPIGMNAAKWCQVKGASRVIGIDHVPERLELAKRTFNIEVFNRSSMASAEVTERLLEMVPGGADVVIDAVGFRFSISLMHKVERALGMETDTPEILEECFKVCRPFGHVSIIGDYVGYANQFPIGMIMMKHLRLESGPCPMQKYFPFVLEKLEDGTIDPSFMITHRISLEEAPKAYQMLNERAEGWVKVLITP